MSCDKLVRLSNLFKIILKSKLTSCSCASSVSWVYDKFKPLIDELSGVTTAMTESTDNAIAAFECPRAGGQSIIIKSYCCFISENNFKYKTSNHLFS